jgi:hypothetical protein
VRLLAVAGLYGHTTIGARRRRDALTLVAAIDCLSRARASLVLQVHPGVYETRTLGSVNLGYSPLRGLGVRRGPWRARTCDPDAGADCPDSLNPVMPCHTLNARNGA